MAIAARVLLLLFLCVRRELRGHAFVEKKGELIPIYSTISSWACYAGKVLVGSRLLHGIERVYLRTHTHACSCVFFCVCAVGIVLELLWIMFRGRSSRLQLLDSLHVRTQVGLDQDEYTGCSRTSSLAKIQVP